VIWRSQRVALAVLAAGVPIVGVADWELLGPSPGGFFSLNLHGLLVAAYVAWALVHAAITSIVTLQRGRPLGLLGHVVVVVIEVGVVGASLAAMKAIDDAANERRERADDAETRRQLEQVRLTRWSIAADAMTLEIECKQPMQLEWAQAYSEASAPSGSAELLEAPRPLERGKNSVALKLLSPFPLAADVTIEVNVSIGDRGAHLVYATRGPFYGVGTETKQPLPPQSQ
jgi:hypothetical protein